MIEHTRLTNADHKLSFAYTIQYVESKTRKGIKFEGTAVLEVKTDGALHFQNRLTEEEIEGIVPLFHEAVIVPNTTNDIDITVFSEQEVKQAFRGSSIKQRPHLN